MTRKYSKSVLDLITLILLLEIVLSAAVIEIFIMKFHQTKAGSELYIPIHV